MRISLGPDCDHQFVIPLESILIYVSRAKIKMDPSVRWDDGFRKNFWSLFVRRTRFFHG